MTANTSNDDAPDDRDLDVFDETKDPAAILDKMDTEPIYECRNCHATWSGVQSEICPKCQSDNRTQVAEQYTIRAKWTMDGAETIDEAIDKFEYRRKQLEALKDAGWDIDQPVTDDYAYLRRPVSSE